tara:strand:+ start:68457 stop:69137 length:681 start_codon:yes stop_codon:yes gene_type:complete
LTNSNIEQGKRLRATRQKAGLTLKKLAQLSEIGESTLRQWETSRSNSGITIKSAHKLANGFRKHSLDCDIDWLLNGKGKPPAFHNDGTTAPTTVYEDSTDFPDYLVQKEIHLFCDLTDKPIIARLNDEAMLPYYSLGTYVGGNQYFGRDIQELNGAMCIVTLKNNGILIRKIKCNKHQIDLYPTNQQEKKYAVAENVDILSLAPITRIWMPPLIQPNKSNNELAVS